MIDWEKIDIATKDAEEAECILNVNEYADLAIYYAVSAAKCDLAKSEGNRAFIVNSLLALSDVIAIIAEDVEAGTKIFAKPGDSK